MKFFTIGVYNSTESEFFDKLIKNGIDTFCDVRQRRGVRGSKYSFVNSNRLQHKLSELDIKYGYIPDLAPTTEIRELQREIDEENGQLKSQRTELGKIFVIEYKNKILSRFNFDDFIEHLEKISAYNVVFFCVEEHSEACHRSLIANKISDTYNYTVTNL